MDNKVMILLAMLLQVALCLPTTVPRFETEEYRKYKGLTKEAWDETQEILRELRAGDFDDSKGAKDFARILGVGSYGNSPNALKGALGTVEGDIWLTPEQAVYLKETLKPRQKRKLADFSKATISKWTPPIEFYIDSRFTRSETAAIKGAIHHFENQTCLFFKELTFNQAKTKQTMGVDQYLYFMKAAAGCGTFIGRVHPLLGVPQPIQLEPACIEQWGATVHEIAHTLGFWHEHQRTDRDGYVTVFPDRMKDNSDPNQFRSATTIDKLPYDYGSVMHYWAWAFSPSLANITIQPHDPLYLYTIGQKLGLSFLDAKLLNMVYCSGRCSNSITCQNHGYQDPNACNRCKCPDGFQGKLCSELAKPKQAQCGGTIKLSASGQEMSRYIKSPGYDAWQRYNDRTECTWLIEAPPGYNVSIRFMNQSRDHFGMYCRYPVCFHYVEVRPTSSNLSLTGPRFCCENLPKLGSVLPGDITSEGSRMMLLMRSNFSTPSNRAYLKRGFRAYVWASRNIDPESSTTVQPITEKTDPEDTETYPGNTQPQLDVAFVMDSSDSVGLRNWQDILSFTKYIISGFTVGPRNVQFGFVTFTSKAYLDVPFNKYQSENSLMTKISSLPWRKGSSNIADGLRMAREGLFSRGGGNRNSKNVILLLTDGPASADKDQTLLQATLAKNHQNTTLMIVGVTPDVNYAEIRKMASRPISKTTFFPREFDQLDSIANDVIRVMKSISSPTKDTSPDPTATPTTITTTTVPTTTAMPTTQVPTTTTTSVPVQTQSSVFDWSCDFELVRDPWCGMIQEPSSDQFDWTRHSGRTKSEPTGPNGAFSGSFYIYIETSPGKYGDTAMIYSPPVPFTGFYCLTFMYNMYGFHINKLHVQGVTPSGGYIEIWQRTGEVAVSWRRSSTSVFLPARSKVSFAGVRGHAYSGDIAIDDIKLVSGNCP